MLSHVKKNPGLFFLTQILGWAFWVIFLGYSFQFLCYPASGSNVTTQCLGSFFSVTQILGQSNPAVGLFIAGILHHLLERAVLSAIKLIILMIKLVSLLYIITFYAEQHTRRMVWITKRTSLASVLLRDEESDALHKINNYIYKDTEYKYFGY